MTGRRLYDKYVDALRESNRHRWDGSKYVLVYPPSAPLAWPFLGDSERATWNILARKLTPRRRKA